MAIEHLMSGQPCPLHISFDIDGLDPDVTPSTGTKVKYVLFDFIWYATEVGCRSEKETTFVRRSWKLEP